MSHSWLHHCAFAYRQLVDAFSYPGDIVNISPYFGENPYRSSLDNMIVLLAKVLLDGEVSFHVIGNDGQRLVDALSDMTGSQEAALAEADFIFVLNHLNKRDFRRVLHTIKVGDLVDPHHSATLCLQLTALQGEDSYQLSGPGVKGRRHITLSQQKEFCELRKAVNAEFPIGFDTIYFTRQGELMALPRAVKMEVQ